MCGLSMTTSCKCMQTGPACKLLKKLTILPLHVKLLWMSQAGLSGLVIFQQCTFPAISEAIEYENALTLKMLQLKNLPIYKRNATCLTSSRNCFSKQI